MASQRREGLVSGTLPRCTLTFVSLYGLAACRHDTINIYTKQAGSTAAPAPPGEHAVESGQRAAGASGTVSLPPMDAGPLGPPVAGAPPLISATPRAGAPAAKADAGIVAAPDVGEPPTHTATTAPPDSGWWMMGYDAHNWYWNPKERALSVESAPQLRELWRATVMGTPNGTPVIAENKVFVTSSGAVYGLDLLR